MLIITLFEKKRMSQILNGQNLLYSWWIPWDNYCRQAGTTYQGKFHVDVCFQYNDGVVIRDSKFNFGYLPVMLKSELCHLRAIKPENMASYREEATEMGGYFICNGLERVVRILNVTKRNYPMCLERSFFRNQGLGYTDKAIVMRCEREDLSSVTVRLYYLESGSARLGFSIRRSERLIPVGIILKALLDTTDREIYDHLTSICSAKSRDVKGAVGTPLVRERAKIIFDELKEYNLFTRLECLQFLGEQFEPLVGDFGTQNYAHVGEALIKDYIFVHLDNGCDKFALLIFMLQKLFAFVDHNAAPESSDALQNHDVFLPGHLLSVCLKDKLQHWLYKCRSLLHAEIHKEEKDFDLRNSQQVKKIMDRFPAAAIGKSIENMLTTGNYSSMQSLDLQQVRGLTIVAERLNFYRFLSHFRSVHRGSSFMTMRTTSVRKLLPESWGFLCPVHTPDGEPCGLLNHMTSNCKVTSHFDCNGNLKDFLRIRKSILRSLVHNGMISLPNLEKAGPPDFVNVLLDGRVIGLIASNKVEDAVAKLRREKFRASSPIPDDLEVGYVPLSFGGAFPGLFLFTSPSRLVRPVKNVADPSGGRSEIELIGPFEQAFMEIKCLDGGDGGRRIPSFPATHEEIHPTAMLSVVASLTPWSDHNQSPRNMYQCQMAKQTMGFSSQALQFRADNKLFHLQTPQSPIVRTVAYDKYALDEFPTGTNAIVAVLAYSGYDMEDAMILNKSSVERGLCHGHIYETHTVDLTNNSRGKIDKVHEFGRIDKASGALPTNQRKKGPDPKQTIDIDGLPYVGQVMYPDMPIYSIIEKSKSEASVRKLKGSETAVVDYVAIEGTYAKPHSTIAKPHLQKARYRLRRPRNPIIGDKFSSRHGQKGVCSQLWPDIDMPFSGVTGMRPDLIINPHAFPSRMTIGMLLESLAAKGGCLKGSFVDATPFASSTSQTNAESQSKSGTPIEEFGPVLASYGFNYHGTEVLYSGVLGTELTCEIFIGPVYYQRLRHMVSDKFQVRSTGPINPVTRQPLKGRKTGGGIRFGEMERDALLAHGASYLLHDRLHTCSDYHVAHVCSLCRSLISTSSVQHKRKNGTQPIPGLNLGGSIASKIICHSCKSSKGIETVAMPYVFRYLAVELAAMNINLSLQVREGA
ncbi:DNA-directed RNA polymerase I subunit 2 isoform X2 [Amborella trichopoda]|uniref:DNA-directed RNA polymerase I subunit 2 isoform X2 n=1 Tax=Amborella trichopoda TaxID=13333 RepID=UPI0009BF9F6F|nr:DNA-directed RNA polymerase I subunit 2 isoform X2 [Amborella trichopoda]|eukprot:XP_020522077.1 DNA-directed RNA polymerase I subunit 2 isoform X2 [Amborella trichopoda]